MTFIQRHDVASTLMRRCLNVACPLSQAGSSVITKTRLYKYIENILRKFSDKNPDIFHISAISAQNIGCGYSLEPPRRGGSNEYPQSMFLNRNKKIDYTPVNSSFTV